MIFILCIFEDKKNLNFWVFCSIFFKFIYLVLYKFVMIDVIFMGKLMVLSVILVFFY